MDALCEYDAFVIDLDGVCYVDGALFPGVPEALEKIRVSSKKLLFVTNNSYRTPDQFASYLTAGPFRADPKTIITSSLSAARLVTGMLAEGARGRPRAVAAGGDGLFQALRSAGIEAVEPEEWPNGAPPEAVVVGIDRRFDYRRLSTLARFVREGAVFVATNTDATYPTAEGLVPGAGSIVAAVEVASSTKAIVAGKPHAPMVELTSEALGDARALVVGDRPDTDLAFAHALGADSALVLSGVGKLSEGLSYSYPPRFVAQSLSELVTDPVELRRSADGEIEVIGGNKDLAREVRELASSAS